MNEAGEVPPPHPNPEAAKTANTGVSGTENPNKTNQYTITAEEAKKGIMEKGDLLARMEREGQLIKSYKTVSETKQPPPEVKIDSTTEKARVPDSTAVGTSSSKNTEKSEKVTPQATSEQVKPTKETKDIEKPTATNDKPKEVEPAGKEKVENKRLIKKVLEQMDKELEDRRNHAKNENEKAMLDAIRERWKPNDNPKKIIEDFEKLKTDNPEQLMRELLKSRNAYGKSIYSDAEIDSLFADKSEGSFYKKMENDVTSQVLRRGILEKGLTKEDVISIENAQWSRKVAEQAFEKNNEAQEYIKKLLVKEGEKVSPSKFWEYAKKYPWALYLAFGLVGGGIIHIIAKNKAS